MWKKKINNETNDNTILSKNYHIEMDGKKKLTSRIIRWIIFERGLIGTDIYTLEFLDLQQQNYIKRA